MAGTMEHEPHGKQQSKKAAAKWLDWLCAGVLRLLHLRHQHQERAFGDRVVAAHVGHRLPKATTPIFPSFYPELFQTRTRVTAMAISQNVGTTITALFPALFAAVAPPGSTNIPLTIGAITFAVTAISAVSAMSARETYRIHLNDLGQPGAVPFDKQDYDQMRARTLPEAKTAAVG